MTITESDREWLSDMLEHANEAMVFLGSASAEELRSDRKTLHAVSNVVQIIGEAASHVSPEGRAALPDVPWQAMIAMRHRLVHGYRARSADILVKTVRERLPALIASLRGALESQVP